MKTATLSILIPAYNEEQTICTLLEKVRTVELKNEVKKEVWVIDDGSTDNTVSVSKEYIKKYPQFSFNLIEQGHNKGKGAALHAGIDAAKGDYIIIQDADLEYDPIDYNDLLEPLLSGHADVVYGSRFQGSKPHRILFYWHSKGNKFLTNMSNMFTNLNLTDMETCYKMFDSKLLKSLSLREKRFGFEPEVTAKMSRVKGVRVYEVGVAYYGRTYQEGKKINWKDGVWAIYCILKYNIWKRK